MMKIPFHKINYDKKEYDSVKKVMKSGWLTMGPKVKRFENQMAEYLNVPFAIAVSNGTVALDIALKTLGIDSGDEVIIPALTYFSTAASVSAILL